MDTAHEVEKLKIELLVLRGAFIEVLWTLMYGDPDTFHVERIARAVDRVGRVIEDGAMSLGNAGSPKLLQQAIQSVEQIRTDLTRGLEDHLPKEPRAEIEVQRRQRQKKPR